MLLREGCSERTLRPKKQSEGLGPSFYYAQPGGKPGSVVDGHLSSMPVAGHIKRLSDHRRTAFYVILLAAGGVYLLRMSPYDAVSSYLTRFILTS